MMNATERLQKVLAANPITLARIDEVLNGSDTVIHASDTDCRTITYTEAARRMGVSRPTIYRLARAGLLKVVPLLGVNRILLQSVVDYTNGKRG